MIMSTRNLSLGLGAAAASSLVMFVAAPTQAATFTNGSVTGTITGYECPTTTCVDLAKGGYTIEGGGLLDPSANGAGFLTPGSDSGDADKVTSYNVTSKANTPDGANTPILVTGLEGFFDFYWGSVDTHNNIQFFNGDTLVGSFTGTDVAVAASLGSTPKTNQGNFLFDAYVKFEGTFDSAKLFTAKPGNQVAFEVATAYTAVPEPTAVMSLLAVGAIAGGSTLKRKNQDS
jgi:hypothetical protein